MGDDSDRQIFTEYEVDSDADREEERALLGKDQDCGGASSASDSECDDVIFTVEAVIHLDSDSDFWADSESDVDNLPPNFDPELGPGMTEVWKCYNCDTPNTPGIRYCHKCWQVNAIE